MKKNNLFDISLFPDKSREQFDILRESGDLERPGDFRLERILSFGQVTPEGEWYDQPWTEWVAVIQGTAVLSYENGETAEFKPGDYLEIPPHRKHRVTNTSEDCIWLAFHYKK